MSSSSSAPSSPPQKSADLAAPELSPEEEQWLEAQLERQLDESELVDMATGAGIHDGGDVQMSPEEMDEFERWMDRQEAAAAAASTEASKSEAS